MLNNYVWNFFLYCYVYCYMLGCIYLQETGKHFNSVLTFLILPSPPDRSADPGDQPTAAAHHRAWPAHSGPGRGFQWCWGASGWLPVQHAFRRPQPRTAHHPATQRWPQLPEIVTSQHHVRDAQKPRRSLTVASCRRGNSVCTECKICIDISSVSAPSSMSLSRRSYSIDKSPCSSNAASPISQRKDINRSESLRVVSNRTHRIFRPSDLIHGEVLGKGCFGQAIKVQCTLYYTTYVNPCT